MKIKKGQFLGELNKSGLIYLIIGVVLLVCSYAAGGASGYGKISETFSATVENMKAQCDNYDTITAADKSKSLIRLSEQAAALSRELEHDDTQLTEEFLREYAEEQRLTGIVVLDGDGNSACEYNSGNLNRGSWDGVLDSKPVTDVYKYPKKIYIERTAYDGAYYDVTAVTRSDGAGLVFCYHYQNKDILSANRTAMADMLRGYNTGLDGQMLIMRDGVVYSTNNDEMKNRGSEPWQIVRVIDGGRNYSLQKIRVGGKTYYGGKTDYKGYSIYAYYPSDSIVRTKNTTMFVVLGIYMLLCMLLFVVRTNIEKQHFVAMDKQLGTIKAISKIYDENILIDFQHNSYEYLKPDDADIAELNMVGIAELLQRRLDGVAEEDRERYREFADVKTLNERVGDREYIEFVYRRNTGRWYRDILIVKNRAENGAILSAVLVTRDMDEQKKIEFEYQERLEASMQQAMKASMAKTDFLRRMSHDIRTPINAIVGMVEMGDRFPEDMERQKYFRGKIRESSKLLLELVSDILTVNKLDSGTYTMAEEPFILGEVLREVVTVTEMQAQERGLDLRADLSENMTENVIGNRVQLGRVLMNIASNAVKYNRKNGYIVLTARELSSDGNMTVIEFECRDNGIGMSEEFQAHMFEPFMREDETIQSVYGGIGLGLSIVKRLVEKMYGTIRVKSKKGEGTTFTLIIPFKIDKNYKPGKQAESAPVAADAIRGVNILLVEDNAMNMEIAEFLLSDSGANVTKAWNGREAVDIWKRSAAGEFDIILMDLMMPEMSGTEAARLIRAADREDAKTIPIVAMTANAFADDVRECLEAGMNAHLAKPIDAKKIIGTVVKYVNKAVEG